MHACLLLSIVVAHHHILGCVRHCLLSGYTAERMLYVKVGEHEVNERELSVWLKGLCHRFSTALL